MYVVQGLGLGRTSCELGILVFFLDALLKSGFWRVFQFGFGALYNLLMSTASLEMTRM